jgi:hypothetical protein
VNLVCNWLGGFANFTPTPRKIINQTNAKHAKKETGNKAKNKLL